MKYIKGLIELIIACILVVLLFPFGILWGWIGKPIYEIIKGKMSFSKGIFHFLKYIGRLVFQILRVIERLCHYMAYVIDLLGNVAIGEFIEDCVTVEELTLYGRGDCTISAATGGLEVNNRLNRVGKIFTKALNYVFREKSHCISAFNKYIKYNN